MKRTKEDILNELNEAKNDIDILNDKYLRSRADFENYKKKTIESIRSSKDDGKKELFIQLKDLFDNIIRQHDFNENDVLYGQMVKLLNDAGFSQFGNIGDKFETDKHEAIGLTNECMAKSGCVSKVFSHGWQYKDGNIVAYAKVFVEK